MSSQKPLAIAALTTANDVASMSSLEISELTNSRHDSVKRTIETLAAKGVIEFPQSVEIQTATKPAAAYLFTGTKGRRDSIIVVARLCPEFTAALVDRWEALETGAAQPAMAAPAPTGPRLTEVSESLIAMHSNGVISKRKAADMYRAALISKFSGAGALLRTHAPKTAKAPAPAQPDLLPRGTVNYFCRGSDTQSATSLIKSHGADITAKILHDLLEREGMMITKYYKQGEEATPYRVLIDDGIGYGQNVLHDDGSHSHPYYYVSKFNALMARVGAVGRSVSAVVAKPTKGEAALDKYKQIMREVWWEGERNMTVVDGKSKPHITYLASLRCLTKSKGMLEKTARNTLSPSGQMMSRLTLDGFCVPHKGGWAITDSDFVFSAPPPEAKVNSVA